MQDNKRRLGKEKEGLAAAYIEKNGGMIIDRNFFFHGGEIDLIAKDGEYLCFVEVKYRSGTSMGYPSEAVTKKKCQTIAQGAKNYLSYKSYPINTPCRFDIISILGDKIEWIKNAFMA